MDDLISRQAAIDALHMHLMYRMGTDSNKKRLDEWINNLPPAQPEPIKIDLSLYSKEDWERLKKEWGNTPITVLSAQPKKGRWISADAMFHGVPFYCSECGENTRDTVMGKPRWKFCPMCGAKMEGADDE